jgi:CheY-like chemotaxis protein
MERRRQAFDVHHDGTPMPVLGDTTRLTQIVVNLLDNASKYTHPGGHISLTLARTEGHAFVRVKDDGMGIAPDLLPRMFDLFVQGDRSLDRSQGGLGLGLTLVQRLVHMHGGTITASSKGQNQGSLLEVRLPLASSSPRKAMSKPLGIAPAAPLRVLVVDDNEDSAETMATLVSIWGHEVRTARDGKSALDVAREQGPQVVLLDIGLPETSGYEVAAQLREIPGLEKATLIAMTGYGQEEDRLRTKNAGFAYHLTKPVHPDSLRDLLSSLA